MAIGEITQVAIGVITYCSGNDILLSGKNLLRIPN
jgi:hypothetical protein